jgi:DNA polymerase-3 subunit alpha
MAALMTADMRWTDRLAIEIAESKRIGLNVLGPDINESYGDFGIVGGKKTIRFGLSGIKGMGKALVEEIVIPERDKNGPFTSIFDFAKRVDSTKFNKKSWESAIKTGVFDRFGYSRSDLLFNLESIQAYGAKVQKDAGSGQTDLFGALGAAGAIPEPEIKPAPTQYSEKEQLLWERDFMGLYLSAHPLDKYDTYFNERTHPMSLITPENNNKIITIGGIITNIRTILTKSNTKMAFVKVENKSAETEIIVFPSAYESSKDFLEVDNVIRVTGRVNSTDKDGNLTSDAKLMAETIEQVLDVTLENYHPTGQTLPEPITAPPRRQRRRAPSETEDKEQEAVPAPDVFVPPVDHRNERVYILIEHPENADDLQAIRRLSDINAGFQDVILVLVDGDEKKPLRMPFKVDANEDYLKKLREIVGENNVKLK